MIRLTIAGLAAALLWCAGFGCSDSLPQVDLVDKLRLIAVRAEPPEIMPGDTTTLDALTARPLGDGVTPLPELSWLWLACNEPAGSQLPTACGVTSMGNGGPDAWSGVADGGTPASIPLCSDQPAAPLCVIGNTPTVTLTPQVTLPASGSTQVIITAIVSDQSALDCAQSAAQGTGAPPDPDHCIISVKRLTVSNNPQPNHNPRLHVLSLESITLTEGSGFFPLTVAGQPPASLTLAAERCTSALVGMTDDCPVGSDAEVESTGDVEPLYVAWYVTAGILDDAISSFQQANCTGTCLMMDVADMVATGWTAPTIAEYAQHVQSGSVHFWAVIRDDRDGVGWLDGSASGQSQ